jgi:alkanesulfonate monooxygenase SsuD/methylene tetrahydromethanopterin reductase-like flavin-dependent oxidoreductase (luciferase family)
MGGRATPGGRPDRPTRYLSWLTIRMSLPHDSELKIGVYINNRAAVFGGSDYTIEDMLDLAVEAENHGVDFVSVGDSILAKPRWSPIVTLAAVAGRTKTVGLSTGILQPHLRNPVVLAQEWLTLDAISGGRATLVVGLGTGPPDLVDKELALNGLSRRNRARAFEEAIEIIKKAWRGGSVDFHGKHFHLDNVDIGLRPTRRRERGSPSTERDGRTSGVSVAEAPPPLLIAAGAYIPREAGYGPNDVYDPSIADSFIGPWERVIRLGDGWMTGMATPAEVKSVLDTMARSANELDMQFPVGFERRLNLFVNVGTSQRQAREEGAAFLESYHRRPMDKISLDRWLISGPPEHCAERLHAYVENGITSFQCVLASVKQLTQLERLAEEVFPQLR